MYTYKRISLVLALALALVLIPSSMVAAQSTIYLPQITFQEQETVTAALAGPPNFGAGLWADDEQWGTKVTTPLPAPNKGKNAHSFDGFFFITAPGWDADVHGVGGWLQAPVMESAPGNPDYNGGRWATFRVTVTNAAGIDLPLTSYAEILEEAEYGNLTIGATPEPDGAHPWLYFQCPLLPYKG